MYSFEGEKIRKEIFKTYTKRCFVKSAKRAGWGLVSVFKFIFSLKEIKLGQRKGR